MANLLTEPLRDNTVDGASGAASHLRITQTQHVGDVLHIFSHIRKTYRVQWVVLQGGSSPPDLLPSALPSSGSEMNAKPRKSSAKGKMSKKGASLGATSTTAKWTQIEDVESTK